ncbi:RNA methyltransferase [Chlamydia abortus]|uniref:23S rRNA (uracil(1939)-C(5))-methyltransferase RlmD n=1 Tax=Chlamydia abortus TaxID=83555 RepID=UPI000A27AB20|nr:23S rRNA (uracil(1939)-C(5))-methyltransferase RlmD [Chlamydia abortus]SGA11791.1 RNA methyltransferase [Chlamydia abortus]SGA12318.1 RNA methyltransferase [Chlamydia abortus]SGW18735.1 RNA methyltransferase [Chlamydia abortus]
MLTVSNCKHLGICGGCSSPYSAYADSLKAKERILHELFAPIFPASDILPIIPCDPLLQGRNKMEFSFFQTKEGEKSLGFITPTKPKQGIPITECLMIHEHAMDILEITRTWWDRHPEITAYYPPFNKGSLCTLTVRIGSPEHTLMVILTTSAREEYAVDKKIIEEWKTLLLDSDLPIVSIVWEERVSAKNVPTYFRSNLLYGEAFIQQKFVLPKDGNSAVFHVRPRSFFQPQTLQGAKIIEVAKEFMDPQGSETLLDLYCGAGTIGIMLSQYVKKVIGVEIVPDAIDSAKENILINKKEHLMEVHLEDVKTFCKRYQDHPSPDVAIIDPPRCGIQNKVLKYLIRIAPRKIIYISCNPKIQFVECYSLIAAGYRMKKVQPLDQFPHSPHLENIILLEREGHL